MEQKTGWIQPIELLAERTGIVRSMAFFALLNRPGYFSLETRELSSKSSELFKWASKGKQGKLLPLQMILQMWSGWEGSDGNGKVLWPQSCSPQKSESTCPVGPCSEPSFSNGQSTPIQSEGNKWFTGRGDILFYSFSAKFAADLSETRQQGILLCWPTNSCIRAGFMHKLQFRISDYEWPENSKIYSVI